MKGITLKEHWQLRHLAASSEFYPHASLEGVSVAKMPEWAIPRAIRDVIDVQNGKITELMIIDAKLIPQHLHRKDGEMYFGDGIAVSRFDAAGELLEDLVLDRSNWVQTDQEESHAAQITEGKMLFGVKFEKKSFIPVL